MLALLEEPLGNDQVSSTLLGHLTNYIMSFAGPPAYRNHSNTRPFWQTRLDNAAKTLAKA